VSKDFNKYVDEYQNVHIQDKILGKGGQGVVFRTKDPDLAIKLVTNEAGNPLTDTEAVERYSKRFRRVRLLPLPENLYVSVPAALLQDKAGYVMQLLSEMLPFSHFWLDGQSAERITPEDIPEWLSEMPKGEAKKIIHYHKTGGLRRRLNALSKCASVLARLHGNGMVYGDISPNNIFVSEGIDDASVWLIDADNIRFEIASGGSVVYTPKYGAPELVQGKDGGRPASDCHAFAVVAFYLLSLIHPFLGRKVDGTDEGDWADDENDEEDIDEKAYAGLLPWVDDQNDDSNASGNGLPRSLLLTEKLTSLFECTFGPGRINPSLRPAIYHWPSALAQAADLTVKCPSCSMNYYYDFIHPETGGHDCPFCKKKRPQVLILESYRCGGPNEALSSPCWRYIREISPNSELTIPWRVFDDFAMLDSDTTELTITSFTENTLIRKTDQSKVELSIAAIVDPEGRFQKLFSQMRIARSDSEMQFWMYANRNTSRMISCSIAGSAK
jgi:serine/threonine protein kinase